ncbi:MAG: transcription elongation factor GreA [Clostridia bacterium]|nr:transcription elongation factor GreA [Clostridia bacterium]
MADTRILTLTDKKMLEEQLAQLNEERKSVAEEIQIARGFGDLSENAEYDAAKAREAEVYGKINEIQGILNTAQFVDESEVNDDICALGTVVRVLDMEYNEEDEYTLVGYTEADPSKLYISNESPIGEALVGKGERDKPGYVPPAKVGDIVEANTPGGVIKLKVLSIRKR